MVPTTSSDRSLTVSCRYREPIHLHTGKPLTEKQNQLITVNTLHLASVIFIVYKHSLIILGFLHADTTINLDQFENIITELEDRNQKAELTQAFKFFDKEDTGSISYEQLEGILKPMLDNEITKEELRAIVEQADTDSSGTIEITGTESSPELTSSTL